MKRIYTFLLYFLSITCMYAQHILALAEQMWHCGELLPFEEFYQRIEAKKAWLEEQGYTFGQAWKN